MVHDTTVWPDQRLLDGMASGDPEALRALQRRHSTSVYALAYGLLIDPVAADEVVAETFAYAWRSAAQFLATANRSVFGWLSDVARSHARARKLSRDWPARAEPDIPQEVT